MKAINIYVETEDFEKLTKLKAKYHAKSWRELVLKLAGIIKKGE